MAGLGLRKAVQHDIVRCGPAVPGSSDGAAMPGMARPAQRGRRAAWRGLAGQWPGLARRCVAMQQQDTAQLRAARRGNGKAPRRRAGQWRGKA
jgi:hypothetical protein